MEGKIPWPIIKRLRSDLTIWATGKINPFGMEIETMILEVAKTENISTDNPESAWEAMGGKLFKKKGGENAEY